ncbi:hypothetical protein [Cellulomonas carbonis]|uniref:hypothetical protein n=1 Tax=Cellulomonas carbonis TaxID=1386092 RepID=UPI00126A2DE5|nr:hypothetical protein [Cellulomonas carbonis]
MSIEHSRLPLLALTGSRIAGLNADEVELKSVAWRNLYSIGEVSVVNARIAGQADLAAASFTNVRGHALVLDESEIRGGLFLRGLSARGEVRVAGARIFGPLDLAESTLVNPNGDALAMYNAQVDGDVRLRRSVVQGQIHAIAVKINGQLSLSLANVTSRSDLALVLNNARIDGGVLLRGAVLSGGIRAAHARVAGDFNLSGATIRSDRVEALSLEAATVGVVYMRPAQAKGGANLAHADIGALMTGPVLPEPLEATGWTIRAIEGPVHDDWRTARAWLDSGPTYSSQPWHEVAAVLDRSGQPTEARRLRAAAAHRGTRFVPWYAKPLRWAYGALAGYGYYPMLAAGWLAIVFSVVLALTIAASASFIPTAPEDALEASLSSSEPGPVRPTGATSCAEIKSSYPCFQPFEYALGATLPAAATSTAEHWEPEGPALVGALSALRAFAWILTALLLAGVTGLLRRA